MTRRRVRDLLAGDGDPSAAFPVVRGASARPPVAPWERQLPLFEVTPFHPGGSKADERAARIAADLGPRARVVFEFVRMCGVLGATRAEVAIALRLQDQQVGPRVHQLAEAGILVDSGRRRTTRTGRPARVWVVRGTKIKKGGK